jgi:ubiquinone/menaquinone biosynthesis C-methylase UbiE
MNKTASQEQFGKNSAFYLTSTPHALGKSLQRLVDLTAPQKNWRVLDIATGGGHVAYTFAPHVARVWATDITQEMLDMVKAEAAKRGLGNLRTTYAKAEALPFEDESFDLVTCRIAPHHFDSIPDYLAEAHRVLKQGGTLAVVDNVVPAGPVGDYVNAFERLRDPSHLRAWTMEEWRAAIKTAGFVLGNEEKLFKKMEFKSWAARYDDVMKRLLSAMVSQSTDEVKTLLEPEGEGEALTFRLCEGLFIAKRN